MKVALPALAMLSVLTFGCGSSSGSASSQSPTAPVTTDAGVPRDVATTPQPAVTPATTPATTLAVDTTVASIPAVDSSVAELSTATRLAVSTVEILDFAFGPQDVQVLVGGQVTWTNSDDQQHTATAAGAFDAEAIQPGASATVVFDTAGSFPYICSFHPFMTGTVTVA